MKTLSFCLFLLSINVSSQNILKTNDSIKIINISNKFFSPQKIESNIIYTNKKLGLIKIPISKPKDNFKKLSFEERKNKYLDFKIYNSITDVN